MWDYDLAAQPSLVRLRKGDRLVDAVVQTTKMGLLFVLDRETGEPLFPIEERPVPESDLPDEKLAATQPVPLKPASLCRREFTEDLVTDISPEAHQFVLKKFRAARTGGLYTPPTKQGTVIYPGFSGGVLWGGISFDPDRNWMYVNSNETTNLCTVVDGKPEDKFRFTHAGYIQLLDPEGYPAIKPPWGKMNCIDLDSGEYVWREVLGEHAELTARGDSENRDAQFRRLRGDQGRIGVHRGDGRPEVPSLRCQERGGGLGVGAASGLQTPRLAVTRLAGSSSWRLRRGAAVRSWGFRRATRSRGFLFGIACMSHHAAGRLWLHAARRWRAATKP